MVARPGEYSVISNERVEEINKSTANIDELVYKDRGVPCHDIPINYGPWNQDYNHIINER